MYEGGFWWNLGWRLGNVRICKGGKKSVDRWKGWFERKEGWLEKQWLEFVVLDTCLLIVVSRRKQLGGGMARRQNGGKRSEMHSGSGKREEKTATFAGIQ